jgi:SAM-dependent methyltransferase
VFLAAQKVGPNGRAIGIDMTPEMIARARANADVAGYANVEFHHSSIDKIPLPDSSVDCVISNCVINLAPDKPAVFREIFRILKPGGRVAVSDIALKGELPKEIATSIAAYTGCIAGAIKIEDYRTELLSAGFEYVEIIDTAKDLNTYKQVENQSSFCSASKDDSPELVSITSNSCCSSTPASGDKDLAVLLSEFDVNQAAASVQVYAIKPAAKSCCGPACCA